MDTKLLMSNNFVKVYCVGKEGEIDKRLFIVWCRDTMGFRRKGIASQRYKPTSLAWEARGN